MFEIIVTIFIVYAAFFGTVLGMVSKTGRSAWWVLFAIVFTPLSAILALHCLGDCDSMRKKKVIEEEMWRCECQNILKSGVRENNTSPE